MSSPTFTFTAVHTFGHHDFAAGSEVPSNFHNIDDDCVGSLPLQLCLCIGARVMLIRNIHTDQGLVNGAIGYIHSFAYDENNVVENIHVLFDDPSVGRVLKLMDMILFLLGG